VEIDAVHDETPAWLDDARILGRQVAAQGA
jgi:hypothetical protein